MAESAENIFWLLAESKEVSSTFNNAAPIAGGKLHRVYNLVIVAIVVLGGNPAPVAVCTELDVDIPFVTASEVDFLFSPHRSLPFGLRPRRSVRFVSQCLVLHRGHIVTTGWRGTQMYLQRKQVSGDGRRIGFIGELYLYVKVESENFPGL